MCDDYPGEELLGEIADTEPRNKYQDERRYPVDSRRHLVDITMAEAECVRLTELREHKAREWGGVLQLLYAERFPSVWSGEDRPNLNLPLWAPAESVLGVLNEWRPEFDKRARAGGLPSTGHEGGHYRSGGLSRVPHRGRRGRGGVVLH